MDTPTITQYYRESDPARRLALLNMSIEAGEEPELNQIRRELWDIRYQDPSELGGDTRADGLIALWMLMEFNKDSGKRFMGVRGGRKEIEDAIARLRAAIPGITLRTTLIAGFPGETEEQYAELCDFVKTVRFDRLGCFAYSAEENTVAARMENQLDEETKQRRADHIMELQAEVSAAREGEKVGNTYECICDGVDDETGMYLLRTKADCPEIDGNVLTPADTPLETGAFYNVTITDADTYDLYGYAEEKLED